MAGHDEGERGTILFVCNDARYFRSHWLARARALELAGYSLEVAVPLAGEVLEGLPFAFHELPLKRGRGGELETVMAMRRLIAGTRPDILHLATLKPVILGGLAARLTPVPAVACHVTGLGHLFSGGSGVPPLMRAAARTGLRLAFAHPNARVSFQNRDDLAEFVTRGLVGRERARVIPGAGVDVAHFKPRPEPEGPPLVVLASRLIWSKGIDVFVEAARRLAAAGVEARFALVGEPDAENPAAVPRATLESWDREGVVEWWGHRDAMAEVLAGAHVVTLPTAYREGVPRVLIEAAACGRPLVTTDTPGCRDIARHGENGLLVPVGDADRLAAALRTLIEDADLRARFGARSRELAVSEFADEHVIAATLALYEELSEGIARLRTARREATVSRSR